MYDGPVRIIDWYGYNQTVLNPIGLTFVILMAILFLAFPKRYALLPIIATACFITHRQRIVLAGLDFSMLRIMIIVGFIRTIMRSEYRNLKLNRIDKTVIGWVIVSLITGTLLWKTGSAFINRLGTAYDILGLYFLFRIFIRHIEDMEIIVKTLVIMAIPIAVIMTIEQVNGRNLFYFLGGVPKYTMLRDGRLRSQAAFSHPILAGTYGAFLLPMVIGYWQLRKQTVFAIIGVIAATIITVTSSSSGPVIAYGAGLIGLFMWKFRMKTRFIFWCGILGLFSLNMVMKAPVWHLISRIHAVGGSTAYYRYRLIDAAVNNFKEWWLFGTKSTAHWGYGLQDLTNMYIAEGVGGGILRLILFLTILILCFKAIGFVVKMPGKYKPKQMFIWGIGSSLFVHAVSFMSVSYFGQFVLFLYMTFAFISTISSIDTEKELIQEE